MKHQKHHTDLIPFEDDDFGIEQNYSFKNYSLPLRTCISLIFLAPLRVFVVGRDSYFFFLLESFPGLVVDMKAKDTV